MRSLFDMKRAMVVLLFMMVMGGISAQNHTVSGTVTDEEGLAVPAANISYSYNGQDFGTVTNTKGKYKLDVPAKQTIKLTVSHIAYETKVVTIESSRTSIVKNIVLKETAFTLDSVAVTAKMPTAKQKGDTTIYYAQAYKISHDATAYDLITQKITGISVNEGRIEVQGETVTDVMIDGKEYYKNDITMALKNLPAYIINEVQVFDKTSDYARLTGFEDATTRTKVLNIVTKGNDQMKVFGKVYGGYGLDNRYDAYGSANFLTERRTLSVFAQSNNVNKQDFSVLALTDNNSANTPQQSPYAKGSATTFQQEDLPERMSSNLGDGVSNVTAGGLNYTNRSADGKFSISGHYLFSNVNNNVHYSILDKFFSDSIEDTRQELETDSRTMSHRANFKLEYQITPSDIIVFSPMFSFQRKRAGGTTLLFHTTDDTLVKQGLGSDERALLGMGDLNYVHKFGIRGSALGANVRFAHQHTTDDQNMTVLQLDDELQRILNNGNASDQIDGKLSYVAPINRASRLKFDLGWGMANLDYRSSTQQSDPEGIMHPDSTLSGFTSSHHQGINAGVAYVYSNHGVDLLAGIDGKRLSQETKNNRKNIDTAFYSVLPFLRIKYLPNTQNQIHFNIQSKLVTPSVAQLHETVNVVDPSMSVCGNANLTPATNYDASLRYVFNKVETSQVFVCFAKYAVSRDFIATKRVFEGEVTGMSMFQPQLLTYENTKELFSSFDMLLAYGFPVSLIKSNVNVSTLLKHSNVPGFCNELPTHNVLTNWNNSITIGSNISEKFDFVIDLNLQYSTDRNVEFNSLSASYWTFSYGGQIKVHPTRHFKATVECGHTGYYGLSTNKYNAWICNASTSFVFGRNLAAEVQLSVNDILDQNNNFYLYTTESYLRETSASVLGRHALLTFIYNFNKKINDL